MLHDSPRGPAVHATAWRIVRLAAPTPAELAREAARAAERAAELWARADGAHFAPDDRCRLATVARDADDLRAKLLLAARDIGPSKAAMLARKDVFVGQPPVGCVLARTTPVPGVPVLAGWASPTNPRVAFLFAGQGSQYPGMLGALVSEFPPAADALREIDAVLRRLGIPPFAEFAGPNSRVLGRDVFLTQLSLLAADTILHRSLLALGVDPDVVAGHSYGEFPALLAADAWDFESAVLATQARCRAVEACPEVTGRMLSIAAPATVVEQACRAVGERLYPANDNSPRQTVVGGEAEAVARLQQHLTSKKIASRLIAVPRPFHTPLMAPVRERLADALGSIAFERPVVPIVSSVTNCLVSAPEQIRQNLVDQITRPVRYVDLVRQLADSGIRAIVEVGPGRVLTGLHAKILAGRDVALMACDDKSRAGLSRLLAVRARLDCVGLLRQQPRSEPRS